MGKQYVDGKNGLKVKLIDSEKKGKIKLAAYIVDPVTLAVLTKTPKTCTFAREEDRITKRTGLVNKACADWTKKHKSKTEKPQELKVFAKSKVRVAFELLKWDDPFFTRRWGAESTRHNAKVFFERNVLPFIEKSQEEGCTRADVEEFHSGMVEKALQNGHTKGNAANVRNKMNQHLNEAGLIYAAMQMACPELVEIDFSPFSVGRAVQSEMAKSLPEAVRQRFAQHLKECILDAPEYVFGAVLMFDAALRTSEAAGQKKEDIDFYSNFAVIRIRFQEEDRKRCEILKSGASYRNVTISYWGKILAQQCVELMEEKNDQETYLTARQLRTWIVNALYECGITDEYMQAARKLMDEEPDYDGNGKRSSDIVAYILRKDCCSRWINICGLQSMDVDYLLGHAIPGPKNKKPNFKSVSRHQKIAEYLENYIFDPAISAHPYFKPVQIGSGEKRDLPPSGAVSIACLDGNGKLTIDYSAREVGAIVEIRVPKGCVPNVEVHTLPRRAQQDRPIIGRQVGSYIPIVGGKTNEL